MKKLVPILCLALLLFTTSNALAIHDSEPCYADSNASHYSATWHSQSGWPTLEPGEITTVWIKYRNTGWGIKTICRIVKDG